MIKYSIFNNINLHYTVSVKCLNLIYVFFFKEYIVNFLIFKRLYSIISKKISFIL